MVSYIRKIKTKKIGRKAKILIPLFMMSGFFLVAALPPSQAIEFTLDADYNKEIWELNQDINDKRKEIDSLNKQAQIYKKSLASKQREIASLSYQVSTLNQTITKISLEQEALELAIEEVNLQIQNSQLKIQATEEEMQRQKDNLADLVRTLYRADKQQNILVILANNSTFSEYLNQLRSLESLQGGLSDGLDGLNNLKIALVDEETGLDNHKDEIKKLREQLEEKSLALEEQKVVKYSLINETKGEESKYQELLQELKEEQSRIDNDIVHLEQVAREKLNRQLQEGNRDLGSGPMIWPTTSRTITSYFHDPDYPYRNIFEHPAIDIRSPQGTPIYASASGYVARAKDAGDGYSYIMIVHNDGLSTVYGHVSSIKVSEGSFVLQGQVIGNSGGMPGTPGAGRLTTGPHLHLEIRLNGIPVNPLNYLP